MTNEWTAIGTVKCFYKLNYSGKLQDAELYVKYIGDRPFFMVEGEALGLLGEMRGKDFKYNAESYNYIVHIPEGLLK